MKQPPTHSTEIMYPLPTDVLPLSLASDLSVEAWSYPDQVQCQVVRKSDNRTLLHFSVAVKTRAPKTKRRGKT